MDANDPNNLLGKEGKMMLLALLKMIFFHAGINDSSTVTLKLREKMSRVVGGGNTSIQDFSKLLSSQVSLGMPGNTFSKSAFSTLLMSCSGELTP